MSRRNSSFVAIAAFIAMLVVTLHSRALSQTAATSSLTTAQIEQLVAPIALYPDDLLSQVLMASTYPLEVVEAARWSRENPKVTGQALQDAMQAQSWDPSVKALAAVPQTLQMMSDELKWTQDLGDAFLAQQTDVFNAVQSLRARADASGNLKSSPQQNVTRTNRPAGAPSGAPPTAYTIVSASPEQVYVPIYDPGVVYGAWPYPAYAPIYWRPPGYVAVGVLGFAGFAAGAAIWGGVNWWNRSVNVNVNRYNSFNRTNITSSSWNHNAAHRGNVPYSNANVAKRYNSDGGRDAQRDAARKNLSTAKDKGAKSQGGKGQEGAKGQGGKGQGGKGQTAKGEGGMGQGGMGGGMDQGGGMGGGGMGAGGMGGGGESMAGGGGMGGGGMGGEGGMGGGGGMAGGGMAGGAGGMAGGGMGGGGMGGMRGR